ncbi:MAG TPA: hypothetical protein PK607_10520 [Aggregatilineales bacterium]|nr:hypothetical protein [Chloroflexota bacterium]HOA25593.1 hypothetical protein [Aggregatilineales bacterium]HQE18930.1 hypothetical protein [Aggregatilineales bacterium]
MAEKREDKLLALLAHLAGQRGQMVKPWHAAPHADDKKLMEKAQADGLVIIGYNGALRLTPAGGKYLRSQGQE